MLLQRMACASCGANIDAPADIDRLTCAHCGTALVVQRGEGYATLRLAEQVSRVIQESTAQTQALVREGARITREELWQLQLRQELTAAQVQLASIEAEMRQLNAGRQGRHTRHRWRELEACWFNTRSGIHRLHYQLGIPDAGITPAPRRLSVIRRIVVGLLSTLAFLIVVGMLGAVATTASGGYYGLAFAVFLFYTPVLAVLGLGIALTVLGPKLLWQRLRGIIKRRESSAIPVQS